MANKVAEAMAAAKAAAEAPVQAQAQESNVAQYASSVPAVTQSGPTKVLTAADMMGGSMTVDAYFKVNENGIKVGDKPGLVQKSFRAALDMSEVFYFFGIKYGNNPPVYERTTDRQVSQTGKSWDQIKQLAVRIDGDRFKGDYRSADVPVTLLEDVVDVGGKIVEVAGARIGKTLSTTEWRSFEPLFKQIVKKGGHPDASIIEINVGYKPRQNASKQDYGVLTFELLNLLDEVPDFAEAA